MYNLKDFTDNQLHRHKINRKVNFNNNLCNMTKNNIGIDEEENIIAFRLKSSKSKVGVSLCDIINFCLIISAKIDQNKTKTKKFSYPRKIMHKLAAISLDITDYENSFLSK